MRRSIGRFPGVSLGGRTLSSSFSSGRGRGVPADMSRFGKPEADDEAGVPIAGGRGRGIFPNPIEEVSRPSGILSALSGSGRGNPMPQHTSLSDQKPNQENRHIRRQPQAPARAPAPAQAQASALAPRGPKLSQVDAIKKAKEILSKGAAPGVDLGGRVTRGRGRGRDGGRGLGRGRGRGRGDAFADDDDYDGDADYMGNEVQDKANEEMLAKRLGPQKMNTLVEAFEDVSQKVLPSPADDAYINAMHTNFMFECEPEYMLGDFDRNPDVDENPPIPLRDFLEKVKPFIMSYEGIESQEEWEEAMKETMDNVPLMKEIVDYYSGPDRVTAKRQQEELERVAKTLPASAPTSVKRFTDRAVLSLQSNPGWGLNKKCQFMDKLVWEASQHYT